jgi:hypothetical protein
MRSWRGDNPHASAFHTGIFAHTCEAPRSRIGKIEDKPAMCIFVPFKAGKDRAILGNIVVSDPSTLAKDVDEAIGSLMKSLKGVDQK